MPKTQVPYPHRHSRWFLVPTTFVVGTAAKAYKKSNAHYVRAAAFGRPAFDRAILRHIGSVLSAVCVEIRQSDNICTMELSSVQIFVKGRN